MASDKRAAVVIRGTRPLIIHSDRGIDPFDPLVKRQGEILANKKTKGLEENIREVEWLKYAMSFYGNADEAPFVPVDNLLKCFSEAAFGVKKTGKKEVQSGIDIDEDDILVEFDGPKTAREMFDHVDGGDRPFVLSKSVRIPPKTGSRVPMSRPRIPAGWTMAFTIKKKEHCGLSMGETKRIVAAAGQQVGLCDWRPRYGLFEVVSFDEVAS